MKIEPCIRTLLAVAMVTGFAACGSQFTHVKPGQSARQALAERNAPPPLVPVIADTPAMPMPADGAFAGPLMPPLPDIHGEPALPQSNDVANQVADLYTRGSFAMQAGQNTEAITSLEEAVKLDPNFIDAWTKLVKLYEKAGDQEKAAAAYKKLKQLGMPNGTSAPEAQNAFGLL